ncbi:MAG TPA: PAS domain-containing protein, partial [Albitalea sp.]
MLLLDRGGRISFANTAALRALPCETGMPFDQLRGLLGDAVVQWVQRCVSVSAGGRALPAALVQAAPAATLPDGRRVSFAWQPLDAGHSALRLQIDRAVGTPGPAPIAPVGVAEPVATDLVRVLWASPFPATIQDASYRLVDVNRAYLDFTGFPREQLIGIDPVELQPEEDRDASRAMRPRLLEEFRRGDGPGLIERRLIDAGGRERWFRAARSALTDEGGRQLFLVVMQDSTAEHAAREHADRSARELDDWFDLSPVGMVLFDEAGLLVRTNPAFDALAGEVPSLLTDASPSLQQLLAWGEGV